MSGRRGSSSELGCADVASSSAARAAALSGTVSRSRSWRSRRAPPMLTPREARRVTSWRSPSFVMRRLSTGCGPSGGVAPRRGSQVVDPEVRVANLGGPHAPHRRPDRTPNVCRIGIARSRRCTLRSRRCEASSCRRRWHSRAAAQAGPAPSDAEYHKLCRAIMPAHVRALFTDAVAPIQLGGSRTARSSRAAATRS